MFDVANGSQTAPRRDFREFDPVNELELVGPLMTPSNVETPF